MKTDPITPPLELIGQWLCADNYLWGPPDQTSITITTNRLNNVAVQAAQWGADMELEATLKLMATLNIRGVDYVRNARRARRPKPPSLKEQALAALEALPTPAGQVTTDRLDTIRRALDALPE